jgi:hypothetical protein
LLSLGSTLLPIAAGFALGTSGADQATAGWLVVGGAVARPAQGLVYGRCYWHALAGTGLRVVGLSTAVIGLGTSIEVGGGGTAIWGGLGLYGASTLYDLLTVSRCTERHNRRAVADLAPSLGVGSLHGAPCLAVSMRF